MAKHPTDNPADPFKKALADATRVLADDPDLAVTYSVDPPGISGDTVRLPQVSRRRSGVIVTTSPALCGNSLLNGITAMDGKLRITDFL